MKELKNIFKYRFKNDISSILKQLQEEDIFYIEISPIVPNNSKIYFFEKKLFKEKVYSMATFSAEFNLINQYLDKRKDYFTCVKSLYRNRETNLIFIQIYNKNKLKKIKEIIGEYQCKVNPEEEYIKIVIEIEETENGF